MKLFERTPWYLDFIILGVGIVVFLFIFRIFVNDLLFVCSAILLAFIWLYHFSYTVFALWQKRKSKAQKELK